MKTLNILAFMAMTGIVVATTSYTYSIRSVLDFTEIVDLDQNDPDVQWDFVNTTTIDLHNDNYYTPENPKGDGCKDVWYKDSNSYIRVLVDASWYREEIWKAKQSSLLRFSVNCARDRSKTHRYKLRRRKIKDETQYIRFGMRVGRCKLSKHKIINAIKIQTVFRNNPKWYGPRSLSPSVNCTIMNSFKTIYIPSFETKPK